MLASMLAGFHGHFLQLILLCIVKMPPLPASIVHSDFGGCAADVQLERAPPTAGVPSDGRVGEG